MTPHLTCGKLTHFLIQISLFFTAFTNWQTSLAFVQKNGLASDASIFSYDPDVTRGHLAINDQSLHFLAKGDPQKPLLLFIHGAPERAEVWLPYFDHFTDDFYTVAYTMRGTYPSSVPAGPRPPFRSRKKEFDVNQLASDAEQVALKLGHKTFSIVAHDWGAGTAWRVAINYPEKVKQMVIMSIPHPVPYARGYFSKKPQYQDHKKRMDSYIKLIREFTAPYRFSDLYKNQAENLLIKTFPDAKERKESPLAPLYQKTWTINEGSSIRSVLNLYHQLSSYPLLKDLDPTDEIPDLCTDIDVRGTPVNIAVHQPILFLYGAKDPDMLSEVAEDNDQGIRDNCTPNMTIHRYPNDGHWINRRNVEQNTRLMKAFLKPSL